MVSLYFPELLFAVTAVLFIILVMNVLSHLCMWCLFLRGLDNHWICKPWNLARGLDTHISNDLSYIIRQRESTPKVETSSSSAKVNSRNSRNQVSFHCIAPECSSCYSTIQTQQII